MQNSRKENSLVCVRIISFNDDVRNSLFTAEKQKVDKEKPLYRLPARVV